MSSCLPPLIFSTMPPSTRPRREAAPIDDFDDDYEMTPVTIRPHAQSKVKQILLDFARRWHWIVLGCIIGLVCASFYLSKTPKLYSTSARLLIKTQNKTVMNGQVNEGFDMGTQEGLNTVAERVRRLDLLTRVGSRQDVRDLPGLVPPQIDWTPDWLREKLHRPAVIASERASVPPPLALGGMISSWLNVSIVRGTRLLDISVTHPVPEVAKAVSDAIAREYLAEVTGEITEGLGSTMDLLDKEVRESKAKLQAANSAFSSYSRALEVQKALEAKENEVALLRQKYRDLHPKMITGNAELKNLQDNFIREFDLARQSSADRDYWETASKELPDKAVDRDGYLAAARQKISARIGLLQSEITNETALYTGMMTKMGQSSVEQQAREAPAQISNLAPVPGAASAPIPQSIMIQGGAFGIMGGLLIAFLFIRLDNKFHNVTQLAGETGTNILAAISDIKPQYLVEAEKQFRKTNPDAQIASANPNWDSRLVFRPGTSATSYAEMFRVLRASVSLLGEEKKRRVTLFTSALPGEGKSSVSANFALAAAAQGRKTLLIDLDLRKPSLHKFFGVAREREEGGITECLANLAAFEDVIIRDTGRENFHLIVSGKRAPNPGELLETGRLAAILDRAWRDYDLIVLDTAPILPVPDTRIVAALAQNICLVVRAEYTPRGAVRRVLEIMDDDGTNLSGIVFNGFKERRRLMGENYSYGHFNYGGKYGSIYGSYGEDVDELRGKKR